MRKRGVVRTDRVHSTVRFLTRFGTFTPEEVRDIAGQLLRWANDQEHGPVALPGSLRLVGDVSLDGRVRGRGHRRGVR